MEASMNNDTFGFDDGYFEDKPPPNGGSHKFFDEDLWRQEQESRCGAPITNKFKVTMCDNIKFNLDEEWYVHRLLPKQGVAMIFGESGTLKSFGVLDLTLGSCIGRDWAGLRVIKSGCIYIAAEGSNGVKKRIEGWKIHYRKKNALPDNIQFGLIEVAPNLGVNDSDARILLADIKSCPVENLGVVVIDTASSSMGGGNENGEGMQTLINNATMISNELKCLVIIIHHSGHTETDRARGWSGQKPAVDVMLKFEKMDKVDNIRRTKILCKKSKDEDDEMAFIISAEKVLLGKNKYDEAVMSLAVRYAVMCEQLPDAERGEDMSENDGDTKLKLLKAIKANPKMYQAQLVEVTGIHKSRVSRLIKDFLAANMIKEREISGFALSRKGKDALAEYDGDQGAIYEDCPI
jgi:RecA-family ATPase